jgi:hypothetical protein
VTLPNKLTLIDNMAFFHCQSLKSVTIPIGVITIHEAAFASCTSLSDVYYCGSKSDWRVITIHFGNDQLINANIHYNFHPLGDIDGDSEITNSDLVTIARYIVGLTEGNTKNAVEAYADMNGDGKVDNTDIVTVARTIVGLA